MKVNKLSAVIFLTLALATLTVFAQLTSREGIGAGISGGYSMPNPDGKLPTMADLKKVRDAEKLSVLHGVAYRSIHGKVCNMVEKGEIVSGKVSRKVDGVLILYREGYRTTYKAVVNYSGDEVVEQNVLMVAIRDGNYDDSGTPIELWDCGKPLSAEQAKQQKAEDDKAMAIAEKIKADKAKAEQARIQAVHAKAVIWLQSQATNGSASAQCSLGLHYLTGQGCETNREQGIYWLQKAASNGSLEASNKLVSLPR